MVRFLAMTTMLVAAVCAVGCGAQPGKPLVIYQRDSHTLPAMAAVGKPGFYALFPGDGVSPLIDPIRLAPGDAFGFQSAEGRIAGAYRKAGKTTNIPLDGVLTNEYVWKFQGDKPR